MKNNSLTFTRILRQLQSGAAIVVACAVLSCGAGFAADLEPITMSFYDQWGHFKVEGSFFVDADPEIAWHVLTDYDQIPQFVHSMKVSKIQSQQGNDLVLQQEGEGGFLFFTQRVHLLLNVHEKPLESIVFEDTSHKDFSFYQGTWHIGKASSGHGLEVIYTLDAEQHIDAPAFLVSDSIQGSVKDLLEAVRREMTQQQLAFDQKKRSKNLLAQKSKSAQDPIDK